MNEFFAMGGYGAYIWPAYAVTFLGLALAVLLVWRRYAAVKAQLARAAQSQ